MASPNKPTDTINPPPQDPPTPQSQPQPETAANHIPEYSPIEENSDQTETPRNPLNDQNAKPIEDWLNGFKKGFYEYMESVSKQQDQPYNYLNPQNSQEALKTNVAQSTNAFSRHFWTYLSMYKGGLAKYYLDESTMSLIFSALGPIGEAWREARSKKIKIKTAWAKNLLNANAVNYYLYTLPEEGAFRLMRKASDGAFTILGKTSQSLLTKTIAWDQGEPLVRYVFTPTLKIIEASHKLANKIESGLEKPLSSEQIHQKISNGIKNKQNLTNLLNEHDGFVANPNLAGKKTSTTIKRNLARRLKKNGEDPFFLFNALAGLAWDVSIGAIVNTIRVTALRIINQLPVAVSIRANLIKVFSSPRVSSLFRVGTQTISATTSGLFSATTLSGGYLGSVLFPNSILARIVGSVSGALYQTGVNLVNLGVNNYYGIPTPLYQYRQLESLKLMLKNPTLGAAEEKAILDKISKISFRGFGTGPLGKFANYLFEHPFVRLPINGLALGSLFSPFMEQQFGWNPITTYSVMGGADYLWQTRSAWEEFFAQDTWKIFGKSITAPNWYIGSLNNPNSIFSRIYRSYLKLAYTGDVANFRFASGMTERAWFSGFKKFITPAKPFFQNFINPGTFLGMGLIPLLTPSIGLWAYVVAPIAGSVAWNATSFVLNKMFGSNIASFNAWGWVGFSLGSLAQLFFPGWTAGATFALTAGFAIFGPAIGSAALNGIVAGINGMLTGLGAISATDVATWFASLVTPLALLSVVGLTLFAGWFIFTGFWVPFIEKQSATDTSSNLAISTQCQKLEDGTFQCCSKFFTTQPTLNTLSHIGLDIEASGDLVTQDLSRPQETTSASRDSSDLLYTDFANHLTPTQYQVTPVTPTDPLPIFTQAFKARLSTPTDQPDTFTNLLNSNPQLISILEPFWKLLQQIANDYDNNAQNFIKLYETQEKLFNIQADILNYISESLDPNNLSSLASSLEKILKYTDSIPLEPSSFNLATPPYKSPIYDPCPDPTTCPTNQQDLKELYDSWPDFIQPLNDEVNQLFLQARTTTDPQPLLDQASTLVEGYQSQQELLESQANLASNLVKTIKKAIKNIKEEDIDFISSTNLNQYTDLDSAAQQKILDLISSSFPDSFDQNKKYYYIPQYTRYQFCTNFIDDNPESNPSQVCSTAYLYPASLTPTAFAKDCLTLSDE